jgi:glutathione S-transferase
MAARHSSIVLPAGAPRAGGLSRRLKWEYAGACSRVAEKIPSQGWIMGDTFTVPDILLVHCVLWAAMADFPKPPPSMQHYLFRVKSRPAFDKVTKMSAGTVEDLLERGRTRLNP